MLGIETVDERPTDLQCRDVGASSYPAVAVNAGCIVLVLCHLIRENLNHMKSWARMCQFSNSVLEVSTTERCGKNVFVNIHGWDVEASPQAWISIHITAKPSELEELLEEEADIAEDVELAGAP